MHCKYCIQSNHQAVNSMQLNRSVKKTYLAFNSNNQPVHRLNPYCMSSNHLKTQRCSKAKAFESYLKRRDPTGSFETLLTAPLKTSAIKQIEIQRQTHLCKWVYKLMPIAQNCRQPKWTQYSDTFLNLCIFETEELTDAKGEPDALIVDEFRHDFIFSDRKSIAWVGSYWVEFSVLYFGLKKHIPHRSCQNLN